MPEASKNARGDVLIVDDRPTEAVHPAVGDLKADDRQPAVRGDAESNDPPVRTDRPDVPIIQRLGVGMGEHVPPDPERFDEFGRLRPGDRPMSTVTADEKDNRARQRAADKAVKDEGS